MKKYIILITCLFLTVFFTAFISNKKTTRIMVFSKTLGFHHASIPAGIAAILKIGQDNNMIVDTTTDANFFNEKHKEGKMSNIHSREYKIMLEKNWL